MKTRKPRNDVGTPRKPAASKKSVSLTIKLRPAESVNLAANAAAAEVCRSEFIVDRCCQPPIAI